MGDAKSFPQVRHLAVVMDGNQRWARAQGLAGPEGHKAGAKAVKVLVKAAANADIEYLTLFAFSSENWSRPTHEVELLMQLFCTAIDEQLAELDDNGIQLRFIGNLGVFSEELRQKMSIAQHKTNNNQRMTLNIAVNYGGQWDIFHAAQQFAKSMLERSAKDGSLSLNEVQESIDTAEQQQFSQYLSLGDIPAVDLFIRTSGELRISNFLLWQLAYAELYFTDTYWPDFNAASLKLALDDFGQRQRRFGNSSQELLNSG